MTCSIQFLNKYNRNVNVRNAIDLLTSQRDMTVKLWQIMSCASLQQGFMRQEATRGLQGVVTCRRQQGQSLQIHCDKPFPLFRQEMPRDTPPPTFNIMTKILTWFQLEPLQPSYCTLAMLCIDIWPALWFWNQWKEWLTHIWAKWTSLYLIACRKGIAAHVWHTST